MAVALSPHIITLSIRSAQFVLAIISLGLAAGVIAKFTGFGRVNYSVAISVFTFIYLILGFIPQVVAVTPPLVVVIVEGIFMIFWLSAFAATADYFGPLSCTALEGFGFFDVNGFKGFNLGWCKMGKALIAIEVLLWLLFVASFALHIIYTVIPHTRAIGLDNYARSRGGILEKGYIYSHLAPIVDQEKAVGTEVFDETREVHVPEGAVPEESITHEVEPVIVPAEKVTEPEYPVDSKI